MPANFCTSCGQRLESAARFCQSCGAPNQSLGQPSAKGPTQFRDADEGEQGITYSIHEDNLNLYLSCAFKNAPLDTEFLSLRSNADGWIFELPLDFIHDLEGVEVLGSGAVRFSLQGANFSYMRNCARGTVREEVKQAYLAALDQPTLHVYVFAHFDAKECEVMKNSELAGRWAICVDEDEKAGLRLVATDIRSPVSGFMLKQNLQGFTAWLSAAASKGGEWADHSEDILASVRSALGKIPDTVLPGLHCLAFVVNPDGKPVDTILYESPEEESGEAETEESIAVAAKGVSRRMALFPPSASTRLRSATGRMLSTLDASGVIPWRGIENIQNRETPRAAKRKWWSPFGRPTDEK